MTSNTAKEVPIDFSRPVLREGLPLEIGMVGKQRVAVEQDGMAWLIDDYGYLLMDRDSGREERRRAVNAPKIDRSKLATPGGRTVQLVNFASNPSGMSCFGVCGDDGFLIDSSTIRPVSPAEVYALRNNKSYAPNEWEWDQDVPARLDKYLETLEESRKPQEAKLHCGTVIPLGTITFTLRGNVLWKLVSARPLRIKRWKAVAWSEGDAGFFNPDERVATAAEIVAAGIPADQVPLEAMRREVKTIYEERQQKAAFEPVEGVKLFVYSADAARKPESQFIMYVDGSVAGYYAGGGYLVRQTFGVASWTQPRLVPTSGMSVAEITKVRDEVRAAREALKALSSPKTDPSKPCEGVVLMAGSPWIDRAADGTYVFVDGKRVGYVDLYGSISRSDRPITDTLAPLMPITKARTWNGRPRPDFAAFAKSIRAAGASQTRLDAVWSQLSGTAEKPAPAYREGVIYREANATGLQKSLDFRWLVAAGKLYVSSVVSPSTESTQPLSKFEERIRDGSLVEHSPETVFTAATFPTGSVYIREKA